MPWSYCSSSASHNTMHGGHQHIRPCFSHNPSAGKQRGCHPFHHNCATYLFHGTCQQGDCLQLVRLPVASGLLNGTYYWLLADAGCSRQQSSSRYIAELPEQEISNMLNYQQAILPDQGTHAVLVFAVAYMLVFVCLVQQCICRCSTHAC